MRGGGGASHSWLAAVAGDVASLYIPTPPPAPSRAGPVGGHGKAGLRPQGRDQGDAAPPLQKHPPHPPQKTCSAHGLQTTVQNRPAAVPTRTSPPAQPRPPKKKQACHRWGEAALPLHGARCGCKSHRLLSCQPDRAGRMRESRSSSFDAPRGASMASDGLSRLPMADQKRPIDSIDRGSLETVRVSRLIS